MNSEEAMRNFKREYYFTMKSYSHRRKLNKLRKELERETKPNNSEN